MGFPVAVFVLFFLLDQVHPALVPKQEEGFVCLAIDAVLANQSAALAGRADVPVLLDNRDTYYTIQLSIGTPGQRVSVNLDTGSSALWVNPVCSKANQGQQEACETLGWYDSKKSTTGYRTNVNGQWSGYISYGDSTNPETLTYVAFDWWDDTVSLGEASIRNQSFGVATDSKGITAGIMGLAPDTGHGFDQNQPYSLVLNSMAKQKLIASRAFSLDLRHAGDPDGTVIFGGLDKGKFTGTLEQVPMVRGFDGAFRLAVSMTSFGVSWPGTSPTRHVTSGDYGNVMLDSGTTLTKLRQPLIDQLVADLSAFHDPDSKYYFADCSMRSKKGSVNFEFGGKVIKVPWSDFILPSTNPTWCPIAVMVTGGQQILGDSFLRAGYFVFDWDNEKVHIAQAAKCTDDIIPIGKGPSAVPVATGRCSPTSP